MMELLTLLRAMGEIQPNTAATRHDCTQIADGPCGHVSRQNRHRTIFIQARCDQRRSKLARFTIKTVPGDALPAIILTHKESVATAILLNAFPEKRVDVGILHKMKSDQ